MTIADDGQGMNYGGSASTHIGKRTGHGQRNMHMRAERLGGTIQRVNENGLKIILTTRAM